MVLNMMIENPMKSYGSEGSLYFPPTVWNAKIGSLVCDSDVLWGAAGPLVVERTVQNLCVLAELSCTFLLSFFWGGGGGGLFLAFLVSFFVL